MVHLALGAGDSRRQGALPNLGSRLPVDDAVAVLALPALEVVERDAALVPFFFSNCGKSVGVTMGNHPWLSSML